METEGYESVGPPFVSPRHGHSHGLECPQSPDHLEEIVEAMAVRLYVVQGVWPDWFFENRNLPQLADLSMWLRTAIWDHARKYGVSEPVAAAHLVKMDHPFDACKIVETYYVENGYSLKDPGEGIGFVESVQSSADAHQAIATALDKVFDVKYQFDQPRPVARVAKVAGVGDIDNSVLQAYPHPRHWSDPAGHGAFFGATARYLSDRWDVPADVEQETTMSCRVAAHFRTFAFMHTASENDRGFDLGYSLGS